jgi:hypothetical protein
MTPLDYLSAVLEDADLTIAPKDQGDWVGSDIIGDDCARIFDYGTL